MLYLLIDYNTRFLCATAGKFISKPGTSHSSRRLNHFVLLLGNEGEIAVSQNGIEYLLRPETFMLLLADYQHIGSRPTTEIQSHYWCHFAIQDDYNLSENFPHREKPELILPEYGIVYNMDKFRMLFHQLIDSTRNNTLRPEARQRVMDAFLNILLTELSEQQYLVAGQENVRSDVKRNCKGVPLTAQLCEWIHMNAKNGITVRDVSEAFGYHGDYLTRVFKQNTGMTITAYIIREKLRHAKQLLLNTDIQVKEITYLCGFHDEKHFMKTFRQIEEVTPSDYRNTFFNMHINRK